MIQFTGEQKRILRQYLKQDPEWSEQTIQKLCSIIGMSRYKIYKWGKDKKRESIAKMNEEMKNSLNVPEINDFSLSEPLHHKDLNDAVDYIEFMLSNPYTYTKKNYDCVISSVPKQTQGKSEDLLIISDRNPIDNETCNGEQKLEDDFQYHLYDDHRPLEQVESNYDMYLPQNSISYDIFENSWCDLKNGKKFVNLNNQA